jgi:hypothetical protein
MINVFVLVHLAPAGLADRLTAPFRRRGARPGRRTTGPVVSGGERGSLTIEQVVLAVALVAVAGLVAAAITAFVNARIGGI